MRRQRDIFWFWLPLFASWLLMTAEGPTISAAINRLPNEVIMLAAQGIVISLSVTLESPIMNMLATATALVKDRESFLLVRKFTIYWAVILTVLTIILAFTPVFDIVVTGWLEAPEEVARWVRPGMQIMTLWSAAIAWRRFLQGVLIHFNQTNKVAWGTAVRLLTSGSTVIGLSLWGNWPGIINGATAWMAGVISEALYATIAVRPLLRTQLSPTSPPAPGPKLTYKSLFWFHLPLAGTSLLILMAQPLVTSSLARLDQPTISLAAWPVLFQIMLMARAAAFALPEVVIAVSRGHHNFKELRRFAFSMAAVLTILVGIFIYSPAAHFYIFGIQDMEIVVGDMVQSSLPFFLLFPALNVITSWLRGLLISGGATKDVNVGMAINLVITAVVLFVGLAQKKPGLVTAAVALNLAAFFENLFLAWRAQNSLPKEIQLLGLSLRQLTAKS